MPVLAFPVYFTNFSEPPRKPITYVVVAIHLPKKKQKHMPLRSLGLFVTLLGVLQGQAQNQNAKWFFGNSAALNFMVNPPAMIMGSQMSATEGCSSIADGAGNTLFYTDGVDVYNSANLPMANSNPPLYGGGNKQGTLIVKQPGNNNLYYIFVASWTGLRYSIVDMSLAAGMGSITAKNMTLTSSIQCYKVAGTRHCNGVDVWIVNQDYSSSTWRAYLLTANGLSQPVLSSTGATHDSYAALKFSPDGSRIASTEWGGGVRLYDFNTSTGTVSNLQVVDGEGYAAWGVEFSPDGSKLYAVRASAMLLQWDLLAGAPAAVSASQYTVFGGSVPSQYMFAALQVAPDGRIYCARDNAMYLSVINTPNAAGAACGFVAVGPSLPGWGCSYGLPNQVKPGLPLPALSYTLSNSMCGTASFAQTATTVAGTSSGTLQLISWNFGDPQSGAANTSTVQAPSHQFTAPGTYTVQMVVNTPCTTYTVSRTITVTTQMMPLNTGPTPSICVGSVATLSASGANSYQWYSAQGAIGSGASVTVSPATTAIYTVVGGFASLACSSSATASVYVDQGPPYTVTGDLNLCDKETTTLTALGANNYSWTSGNISYGTPSSIVVTPFVTTSYSLQVSNSNYTCTAQQVITVTVNLYPVLTLGGNATLCAGAPANLSALGAASYSWMATPGLMATGPLYTVVPITSDNFTLVGSDASGECLSELPFLLVVDACLGIQERSNEPVTSIYPNPCSDYVYLEHDAPCVFTISDLLGRQHLQGTCSGRYAIRVDHLADGVYLLQVRDARKTATFRLILESR